jgi:conjugal transfer pilus assembly protein TraA
MFTHTLFQTQFLQRKTLIKLALFALMSFMMLASVMAGTDGAEFEQLYNLLLGWAEGFLARSIAIAALIVGALYGLAKQNPILALIGIVFAVILAIGPNVIGGIVSAVI